MGKFSKMFDKNLSYFDKKLLKWNIEKYDMSEKGLGVKCDVDISNEELSEIPFPFNYVGGYFECSGNNLTSLKNLPKFISGNLYIQNNGKQFTEQEIREVCLVTGKVYI